eukprot:IDg17734t1
MCSAARTPVQYFCALVPVIKACIIQNMYCAQHEYSKSERIATNRSVETPRHGAFLLSAFAIIISSTASNLIDIVSQCISLCTLGCISDSNNIVYYSILTARTHLLSV